MERLDGFVAMTWLRLMPQKKNVAMNAAMHGFSGRVAACGNGTVHTMVPERLSGLSIGMPLCQQGMETDHAVVPGVETCSCSADHRFALGRL